MANAEGWPCSLSSGTDAKAKVCKPDLQGTQQELYKDFKEGLYHPLTFSDPHSVDSNPRFHCPGQTLNS